MQSYSKVINNYNPRYIIPDNNLSIDTISTISLKLTTGSIFDIKKTIIEEKSTLSFVDNTYKKSCLHYILINSELSNSEKFDLTKYVINLGCPIDTPDINGVRPFHIACMKQLIDVVKLLLSKKVEINSKDNNFLTPLHYAVLPNSESCKVPKKLLPDIEDKIAKIDTNDIFKLLGKYLDTDPIKSIINLYFKYIEHILNNYDDFDKIILDNIKKFEDVNDSKITDLQKKIIDGEKRKINKPLNDIEISENILDGWGPDADIKILPETYIESLNKLIENIEKKVIKIKSDIDNTYNLIDDCKKIN